MYTTDDMTSPTMPTAVNGSQAAARLLEIAANNAEQLIAEYQAEAATLVATAQAEADHVTAAAQAAADQLTAASQTEADEVTASARTKAEQITSAAREEAYRVRQELGRFRAQQATELEQHRESELSDVAEKKAALEAAVSHLQEVEAVYQERMRAFLTQQLVQLDHLGQSEDITVESMESETAA